MMKSIATVLREQLGLRDARLTALAERVAQLEQKAVGVKWAGVYEAGARYAEGQLVTRGGGLWLCASDTVLAPGTSEGASDWRLIVKRGDYGR